MRKLISNKKGFTLIEMMIVLFIISILLIITIPNATKHQANISNKGCEGLVNLVQAQAQSYWIDNNVQPDIETLQSEGYIKDDQLQCPNGEVIVMKDGVVLSEPAPAIDPTDPADIDNP